MPTDIPEDIGLFRDDLTDKGRLMFVEEDERLQFKFTIWFDYTRQLFNNIKEGDLLAVSNFATSRNSNVYSIVEVNSVMPYHFALGGSKGDIQRGYPGFTVEAARNLSSDWVEQENRSMDDTTKIIVIASPIKREIIETGERRQIQSESAMPMMGFEVEMLSLPLTELVFNEGLLLTDPELMVGGTLIRSEERGHPINIMVNTDSLIKTHFGLFGFTGVGKSNLLSTLISNLFEGNPNAEEERESKKVVLFDLMDEYKTLLIDYLLCEDITARIICLGESTLPYSTIEYLNTPHDQRTDEGLRRAARDFHRQSLFPRTMRNRRNDYIPFFEDILRNDLLWLFTDTQRDVQTLREYLEPIMPSLSNENDSANTAIGTRDALNTCINPHLDEELTPELAQQLINDLGQFEADRRASEDPMLVQISDTAHRRIQSIQQTLNQTATTQGDGEEENIEWGVNLQELRRELNDNNSDVLYIVISHSNNEVREFTRTLCSYMYGSRRRSGTNSPGVSFIFDEADEFIPGEPSENQMTSKRIIEQLARRGRKFGLGVGIATQRIAYMDTKVMGQLHTYYISKLPRAYDRTTVGEAFSLSDMVFKQTFKFRKGDWLLVSHEALGIDSTPIPIHSYNAEARLAAFLDENLSADEEEATDE